MFSYFGQPYEWDLAVALCLATGGVIGEIDSVCRPLRTRGRDRDADHARFAEAWISLSLRLRRLADQDRLAGHARSAAEKYERAACYLGSAERLFDARDPARFPVYEEVLELVEIARGLGSRRCGRVEVPYRQTSLPGYLVMPACPDGPVACVIQWNGLDSTKEQMLQSGFADRLAARGMATLVVDTPGSGEALRLRGLHADPRTEKWAAACLDFLARDPRIDAARTGLVGWSLGGYYAPRAAAFEPRIRACVAWGANHRWGALQLARLRGEGGLPVPHYWNHVLWVWGQESIDDFLEMAPQITLDGVVDRLRVPFLIVHGTDDRQIPVADAERTYQLASGSPHRELKLYDASTGADAHIGLDNLGLPASYIADWFATHLGDEGRHAALSGRSRPGRAAA